ncbi:MAG: DUF177 domain-containing protein [Nitrospinae bacterium]|nr:DUF177 domain-containing protein [Nitrospinota bacterium]
MSLVIDFDDIPEDEDLILDLLQSPEHFKIDPEEGVLQQDVRVQGRLSKVGREILFKGNVSTEMELVCFRCLESLRFPVRARIASHYIFDQEAGTPDADAELHASDIEVETYSDNRIDLTQAVYDQMMLSLPLVRLCRDDCRGICAHCGVNRNHQSCTCSDHDSIDPRLAVLKTLKDQLK